MLNPTDYTVIRISFTIPLITIVSVFCILCSQVKDCLETLIILSALAKISFMCACAATTLEPHVHTIQSQEKL